MGVGFERNVSGRPAGLFTRLLQRDRLGMDDFVFNICAFPDDLSIGSGYDAADERVRGDKPGALR